MEFLHEGSDVPLGGRPAAAPAMGSPEAGPADAAADAGAAPAAEDEAAAGTFTVTIPEGVEAGQQLQVRLSIHAQPLVISLRCKVTSDERTMVVSSHNR